MPSCAVCRRRWWRLLANLKAQRDHIQRLLALECEAQEAAAHQEACERTAAEVAEEEAEARAAEGSEAVGRACDFAVVRATMEAVVRERARVAEGGSDDLSGDEEDAAVAAWQADVARRVREVGARVGFDDTLSEAEESLREEEEESDGGREAPRTPEPASRSGWRRRLPAILSFVTCSVLAAASASSSVLLSLACLLPAIAILFGLTFRSVTGMGGGEAVLATWAMVGRVMAGGCRMQRVEAWVQRLRRGPPQYSHAAARMPPWILRRRGRRQV